jgi:peptidoglycan/xylan/chitin deacetylase (PgdA/CDA1 family)/GT2 family glycosyltransferase
MSRALVSIIIPTYNRSEMLLRTLESVKRQTHREWEAIVIDDGSTDGTSRLFEPGVQDGRIRYIRQENAGVSAARNTGLRAAQGDFIAFLDSDDLWRPWKLEVQVTALQANPDVGMVWTDMEAIDSQDYVLLPHYLRKFYTSYQWFTNDTLFSEHRRLPLEAIGDLASPAILHVGNIFLPMLTGNLVHTSTAMVTRSRLAAVRLFDESIKPSGEDYDFHLRTCREGAVGFLDVVSTSYRIGGADQLTKPQNAVALAEHFVRTVTTALQRDGGRVDPKYQRLIVKALGEGYAWAADENLKMGQVGKARRHLANAVWCDPRNIRTVALLGASMLPGNSTDYLRAAYRVAKATAKAAMGGGMNVAAPHLPVRRKRSRRAAAAAASRYAGLTWVIRRLPQKASLIVLTYHRVCDVATVQGDPHVVDANPEVFERQLQRLKRTCTVVGLQEAIAHVSSPRSRGAVVLITFDDGYLDNYEVAFPILRSVGLPATFFLTTAFVGSAVWPWWDRIAYAVRNTRRLNISLGTGEQVRFRAAPEERLQAVRQLLRIYYGLPGSLAQTFVDDVEQRCEMAAPLGGRRFLDWDEAKEMRAAGMDIGAHSHTHPVLSRLPAADQYWELAESRRILEQRLGCDVHSCAYPVGGRDAFDETTIRAAERAGYQAAFSYDQSGFNSAPWHNPLCLSRIEVGQEVTPDLLELRVALLSTSGRAHV